MVGVIEWMIPTSADINEQIAKEPIINLPYAGVMITQRILVSLNGVVINLLVLRCYCCYENEGISI
jgi:hypothetical protein